MSDILKAPVYEGRPKLGEGRLEKEIRTYDLLDRLEISYLRLDHEAMPTIEACRDVDKRLQIHICKNLFLCNSGKTDFYLLLMPGEKKFHTREVSSQLGVSRLSFAPEEKLEELLDLTPGSVTVLGLMNDSAQRVKLLMDRELLQEPYMGCHPCINTSSIRLSTRDVLEKFLPAVNHMPVFLDLSA